MPSNLEKRRRKEEKKKREGGQCPPYDRMELVRWALPTQLDGIPESEIAGRSRLISIDSPS
jgi:hypothetical protein